MPPAVNSPMNPGGNSGVLIWGATGQAKVVRPILQTAGFDIVAVCDRNPVLPSPFEGVPIFHAERDFLAWAAVAGADVGFVAAIGGTHGRHRLSVDRYLSDLGFRPVSAIHATASVESSALIGPGAQVSAMAAISVESRLGRQCIVNTNATVDHEVSIGDGVHVMPGATVLGAVEVGSGASVGSNATILPRLRIGRDVIVGAGAVVTRNVPDGTIVAGVPARNQGGREPEKAAINPWHDD